MIGRIACNCVNTSDNIAGKLSDFFVEKLSFHKSQSLAKTPLNYDDVTKKLLYSGHGSDEDIFSDEEGDEDWESEGEIDE